MCTKYFAVDKKSIFRSNKTSSLISKKNELKSKQSKQKFKNKKVAKPETSNSCKATKYIRTLLYTLIFVSYLFEVLYPPLVADEWIFFFFERLNDTAKLGWFSSFWKQCEFKEKSEPIPTFYCY